MHHYPKPVGPATLIRDYFQIPSTQDGRREILSLEKQDRKDLADLIASEWKLQKSGNGDKYVSP